MPAAVPFCKTFTTQCDLLHHMYTSSRQSNGDGEVCPEVSVKEEGQSMVMVRTGSAAAHTTELGILA